MKDYEQLYYDALHEIKQLKKRIEELESDLELVNSHDLKKLNLRKEIIKEINIYKNTYKRCKNARRHNRNTY